MATRFEALEPTYDLVGNAPKYRIQFIDDSTGSLTDPDSVDKLEIINNNTDTLLRTYTGSEIDNPQTGKYEVQDNIIDESKTLELRWSYTVNSNQITTATAFEVVTETQGGQEKLIKDHVLNELGQGRVWVEIPEGTLDTAIYKAKQWYAMYHGQQKRTRLTGVADKSEYDLPSDTYYVFDVVVPGNARRLSTALGGYGIYGLNDLGIDSLPTGGLYGPGSSSGYYSSLVQSLQYSDMAERILGQETTWEHLKMNNKLKVYPKLPTSGDIVVDYVSTEVDLTSMSPQEYMFIKEYTLAESMEILGRIRGKFTSGFPAAQGQQNLDADIMRGDGQEKKRELKEEIQYWAPSGWVIKG